jgi:UDP-N-acetylmuramoylalanine--D-glutamate ligase
MIDLSYAKGQHYAVMGLDKSGLPAVRALLAAGAKVTAWDDNSAQRDAVAALGAELADLSTVDTADYAALVLTPGIAHKLPQPHPVAARFAGKPIICDIELFARSQPTARIIGITGTDGKSTTTALITHILQQAGIKAEAGGNFGRSPLEIEPLPADGVYVLELSSYQLERCPSLALDIAIILNLTPDHLERHGDMDGYATAKAHIFAKAKGYAPTAIYGTTDKYSIAMGEAAAGRGWRGVPLVAAEHYEGIDLMQLPTLQGEHNRQNALAAIEACQALGLSLASIGQALRSYPGLPHRQQLIATFDGVRFINDSKATNANATSKALACYDNIYWIIGGQPKAGGLSGLESFAPRIRKAYAIGQAEAEFAAWCEKNNIACERCGTLDVAVTRAASDATKDASVLLSPACASWDQYKSYEHRGTHFAELVEALTRKRRSA